MYGSRSIEVKVELEGLEMAKWSEGCGWGG